MDKRASPNLFELLGIGAMSALCILAGLGGGYWIGQSTGAGVVATLVGLALGCGAAIAATYFTIKRFL